MPWPGVTTYIKRNGGLGYAVLTCDHIQALLRTSNRTKSYFLGSLQSQLIECTQTSVRGMSDPVDGGTENPMRGRE